MLHENLNQKMLKLANMSRNNGVFTVLQVGLVVAEGEERAKIP
jgi:acyl CoA:acetate/3-ketoacid CoA transferase